jgi:hypothetical protein
MMGAKDDHQKCEGTVTTSVESVKAKSGKYRNRRIPKRFTVDADIAAKIRG